MRHIERQRPLRVPAVPARSAASSILRAIESQREGWNDFALYLDFAALGLPDVGYVAIPVRIDVRGEQTEPRHEIRFTMRARRSPEAFPVFDGAIGVDAAGPSSAQLWLAGTYEGPKHGVTALLERGFATGASDKTLENMLRELADAIESRVEQRERASARYRLIFNTGD